MIVEAGKFGKFQVQFIKDHPENQNTTNTICKIFALHPEGKLLLSSGLACQNPKDQYNKFVGKKLALTRALGEMITISFIIEPLTARQIRSIFWEQFHKEFGHLNSKP